MRECGCANRTNSALESRDKGESDNDQLQSPCEAVSSLYAAIRKGHFTGYKNLHTRQAHTTATINISRYITRHSAISRVYCSTNFLFFAIYPFFDDVHRLSEISFRLYLRQFSLIFLIFFKNISHIETTHKLFVSKYFFRLSVGAFKVKKL